MVIELYETVTLLSLLIAVIIQVKHLQFAPKTGECLTCPVPQNKMGNPEAVEKPRKLAPILDALESIIKGPAAFLKHARILALSQSNTHFGNSSLFLTSFNLLLPMFYISSTREISNTSDAVVFLLITLPQDIKSLM
jgi:hypothetical protein